MRCGHRHTPAAGGQGSDTGETKGLHRGDRGPTAGGRGPTAGGRGPTAGGRGTHSLGQGTHSEGGGVEAYLRSQLHEMKSGRILMIFH